MVVPKCSWIYAATHQKPLNVRILGFMQQTLVGVEKNEGSRTAFDTIYLNHFPLFLFSSDGTLIKKDLFLPKSYSASIAAIYQYSGSLIEL